MENGYYFLTIDKVREAVKVNDGGFLFIGDSEFYTESELGEIEKVEVIEQYWEKGFGI